MRGNRPAVSPRSQGARVALTVVVLVLLAVVLTAVIAPWAPERSEAANALFSSATAAPHGGHAAELTALPGETQPGAQLASSAFSGRAVADG